MKITLKTFIYPPLFYKKSPAIRTKSSLQGIQGFQGITLLRKENAGEKATLASLVPSVASLPSLSVSPCRSLCLRGEKATLASLVPSVACLHPTFSLRLNTYPDFHRKSMEGVIQKPQCFSTWRFFSCPFLLSARSACGAKRQLSLRSFLRSLCSLRCPFFYASL